MIFDYFCCAGGAGKGYHDAGFEVVGIDINPQPNYPYEFVQMDALLHMRKHGHKANAGHGSPPCQWSTALRKGTNDSKGWGKKHINLIPETRVEFARLHKLGIPTVIENVQGSDLRRDLTLCGTQFGLKVFRHRYFEIEGFKVPQPVHERPGNGRQHFGRVAGYRHSERFDGEYFAVYGDGGGKGSVADWQRAMGIDWTDVKKELAEAIPPAYTAYIGRELFQHLASCGLA